MQYYNHKRKSQNTSPMANETEQENNSINTTQTENKIDEALDSGTHSPNSRKKLKLSIPRTSSSHSKCLFYDKRDDLIQISKDVIINTFVDQGIFIPAGARCCEGHITEQSIFEDRSKMKITSNETEINSEEIKGLLSDSEKESWLRF